MYNVIYKRIMSYNHFDVSTFTLHIKILFKNSRNNVWGIVDTIFFEKTCQKRIRRSNRWRTQCNRPTEEREGRSTRFADGQRDSTLTVGQQVKAIGPCKPKGSDDGEEEGGNQRDTSEGKHGGGGSIYDWRRVKESVVGSFWLLRESFLFLVALSFFRRK
jgi:hypothetical protein